MSRCGLVLLGLLLGVVAAEALVRFAAPRWMRATNQFVVDPAFGFRPTFGGEYSSETGTQQNGYQLAKPDSVERVLYIGDSVTHRGRIVGALTALYGDGHYEHWNAGVESFNTAQEVEYYRRYNRAIEPNHIVLTLHNNDFGITPVAFLNSDGQPVVHSLGGARFRVNNLLLQHSSIYRLILRYRLILSATLQKDGDRVLFEGQVREALAELRDLAHEDGARLTVLVLPILEAQEDWTASERRNHETAIRLLEVLDIRYFDLLEPLEYALENGIETNEKPGDTWHPGDEVAEIFASYLLRHELLEPSRWSP